MLSEPVICHSERFSPDGNIAAEGVQRLLGAPSISALETVIRESVQNSWDARLRPGHPSYGIRVRQLQDKSLEALKLLFRQLPGGQEAVIAPGMRHFLSSSNPVVMEISDFGTRGLGGPVRADIPPAEGEPSDFVAFLRNIGRSRGADLSGGTYGFGRSAIYAFSRCRTLVIDTLTTDRNGHFERRLIAAAIGSRFKDGERLHTGRHWWGRDDGGTVVPLIGEDARTLADALGLPDRSQGQTGTTLMLLDPNLQDLDPPDNNDSSESTSLRWGPKVLGARLCEILLWHFWPKLVPDDQGVTPMNLSVEVLDEPHLVPLPDSYPPMNLLADALRKVRRRQTEDEIRSGRPKAILGHLAIRENTLETPAATRLRKILGGDDNLIPSELCHVALMRPAELVVRYQVGAVPQDTQHSWGGVFMCSDEEEIEQAFADSEPAAHDDWKRDYLSDSRAKTFVNVALTRIGDRVREQSGTAPLQPDADNPDDSPSIASLSQRLGSRLLGFGNAPSRQPGKGALTLRSAGSRRARSLKVSQPEVMEILTEGERTIVRFRFRIDGPPDIPVQLRVEPLVMLDDRQTESLAPNGRRPELIRLSGPGVDQERLKQDRILQCQCSGAPMEWTADVTLPDYVAITLKLIPVNREEEQA